ncbi:MAG: hydroxymethylbilane synthase [Meiothermus sp.]
MSETVRIATRGSRLALWQAEWVAERLQAQGLRSQPVIVETQGDREQGAFSQMLGQGFFTKAVQDALLRGQADLAVHSLKDLPTHPTPGLVLAAIPVREDPREALLVHPQAMDPQAPVWPLRHGAKIGSSAVRRQAQLAQLRPDLERRELRGNVPTRVDRLRRGDYGAILLAWAGLKRLGLDLSDLQVRLLEVRELVPAPGQGALALECREEDTRLRRILEGLDDPTARLTVAAERGLMARLQGGCQLALGANAQRVEGGLELVAWYGGQRYAALGGGPEDVIERVYGQLARDHPEGVRP